MSTGTWIALGIAVLVVGYLVMNKGPGIPAGGTVPYGFPVTLPPPPSTQSVKDAPEDHRDVAAVNQHAQEVVGQAATVNTSFAPPAAKSGVRATPATNY